MVFDPLDDDPEDREPDTEDSVRDPGDRFKDPEGKFTDPNHDSVTIPQVGVDDPASDSSSNSIRIPEVTAAETDAPEDILETFWVLVLVLNGAILALSLGAMFLFFEDDLTKGGWLLTIGVVLTGFSVHRYQQYQQTVSESTAKPNATHGNETTGRNESDETLNTDPAKDPNTTSPDDSGQS
ncbi:DUF7322 domain-containing protein [Natrinema halophilum]|uniref:DUF7322 domain-containing protein n=1 Tax=Natrinema halophilum TaxID=1699371 RepID=A0A7D5GI41_9EURY|nr:hypothetical protein [Natrinema halophilum]QLG47350.1 hypothetical protein HYG82_00085 [Natrinema halophilum]